MSEVSLAVPGQLPEHFSDYYPKLVQFLELYYVYLHREKGLSDGEIQELLSDQSWYTKDIEKFVSTGEERYFGSVSGQSNVNTAIVQQAHILPPGAQADRLMSSQLLERTFDGFQTSETEYFVTADDNHFQTPYIDEGVLNNWFTTFGFPAVGEKTSASDYDPITLLNVLKSIYRIKGTQKCIELFFLIFFSEEIAGVYLPKDDIARLDDNMVLDNLVYLRDDMYYNEYSYVIRVLNDPSNYTLLFESIYKTLFHPAGFAVYVEQGSIDGSITYLTSMSGIKFVNEDDTSFYVVSSDMVNLNPQLVGYDGSFLVTYDNIYKYALNSSE